MDIKKLGEKLHPLERKVLPTLKTLKSFEDIQKASKLSEVEVMRALQWLENKSVLNINKTLKEIITLDKNGLKYLKNNLPEKNLLKVLASKDMLMEEAKQTAGLDKNELTISLGLLRKKSAITLEKNTLKITKQGKELIKKDSLEEQFLAKLPIETKKLKDEDRYSFEQLKKRSQIIKTEIKKIITVDLTALGKQLINQKLDTNLAEQLTPELLRSTKIIKLRRYDVKINVPKIFYGKRQPYMQFLEKIKLKLVELGFEEMTGPLIESEFYNFDVLFQPQNHPARTWTDTYKLKHPKSGFLPDKKIVNAVKASHETGKGTDSKGWQYEWSEDIAKQLLPRAHGTAVSGRQLAKGIKIPGKYFAIARCYRPDVLDATHLIEFNQMEGFVAGEELNFKNLLGLLKSFATEIAHAEKVKFYPDYYPFTEPSVQLSAKHPDLGWVEFGGAGIFRPELTKPLGINTPVIAWGLGIDRLAMFKLGIKDIRYLFSSNLKWLRSSKICQQ